MKDADRIIDDALQRFLQCKGTVVEELVSRVGRRRKLGHRKNKGGRKRSKCYSTNPKWIHPDV